MKFSCLCAYKHRFEVMVTIMLCCYVHVITKRHFSEGNVHASLLDFTPYFWAYLLYFERGYNALFIASIRGYFAINNTNSIATYTCRFPLNRLIQHARRCTRISFNDHSLSKLADKKWYEYCISVMSKYKLANFYRVRDWRSYKHDNYEKKRRRWDKQN